MTLTEAGSILLAEEPAWVCEPATVALIVWPETSVPEVTEKLFFVSGLPS